MLRLLADEDFDHHIVRGMVRELTGLDIIRVQDLGLGGKKDPAILERAAQDGRPVITHDVNTMVAAAYERVAAGLPMPGVFVVPQ